jgi:hypothetical protein
LRKALSDSDGWCGYDQEYLESIFKEWESEEKRNYRFGK